MAKQATPYGNAEAIDVEIKHVDETTSTIVLMDGTTLKLRPIVLQVSRLEGLWDPEGMPVYNVRSQMAMFIAETDESLKRRG